MIQERAEEYLGAVYRLRTAPDVPVPISHLGEYFGFSPVSVHEMVQKLVQERWVDYHPYHGVTLTQRGTELAESLLRRHRLWERFLTDMLEIPWEDAHAIAGNLEHAAPETVTERLANLLGHPEQCPHGAPIPPQHASPTDQCLASLPPTAVGRVTRIAPETPSLLRQVQAWGLLPATRVQVVEQGDDDLLVKVKGQPVHVPLEQAQAIWIEVF